MKAIIEHLDLELYPWCLLEYRHISQVLGKSNVIFTNVQKKDVEKLKPYGTVYTESVKQLKFVKVCVLDPFAKETLAPADAPQFDYYLFGGILGNYPMERRTEKELTVHLKQFSARNIGDKQMSTDTAVVVVHNIVDEKIPLSAMRFADELEVELEEGYSKILPYRYLIENGKPVLPEGLIEYLKEEESFLE